MAGTVVTPRRLRTAAVVAVIAAAMIAIWMSVGRTGTSEFGPGRKAGAGTDLVQQFPPDERDELAPFEAKLLDGGRLSSTDLLGTPTVVNVWGSWCGPCRVEAPDLARVARQMDGRVRFLGLNVRDNPEAARAFERAFEIPYPSVHPEDSPRAILAFNGALTAAAVPSTVVLDRENRIAARVLGVVDATTLRGLVRDVLAESEAPPGGGPD